MKLYVGNLSKQVTDAQLKELAAPYGKIVSSNVATERMSGASKGFGFVEFSTPEEAKAAIAGMNGLDVHGQALTVNESRPRKDSGAPRF